MGMLWGDESARAEALAEIERLTERDIETIEREARLTDDVVAAMRAAGAFRMPMPKAWGGPELPMVEIVDVLEELSYIEGAVGWNAMIGCDGGFYSAWLDDEVGRGMYKDLDAITAGWVVPAGQATPVDGGFRFTGRWSFGSASNHASWFCSGGLRTDTFEWRLFFVPAEDVTLVPGSWDTTGLRGSGSNDYTITDVFVPEERSFVFTEPPKRAGSLYAYKAVFASKVAAVPLGLARRAIDEAARIAETKITMPAMKALRDLESVQTAVARAEALVSANRLYYRDSVARVIEENDRGGPLSDDARRHLWLSASSAVQASRDAVEILADVIGTDGVRRSNRLERIRRDVATAATHVVGRQLNSMGKARLGLDPENPLY